MSNKKNGGKNAMKIFLGIVGVAALVTTIVAVENKSTPKRPETIIEKIKHFFQRMLKKNVYKQKETTYCDDMQLKHNERIPNLYKSFCCEICQVFQYILALDRFYNEERQLTEDQYKMVVKYEIIENMNRIKNTYSFIDNFNGDEKYQIESVDYIGLINGIKTNGIIKDMELVNFKNPDEVKRIASVIEKQLNNCGLTPLYMNDSDITEAMRMNYNVANVYYIDVPAIYYDNGGTLEVFDNCVGLTKEDA